MLYHTTGRIYEVAAYAASAATSGTGFMVWMGKNADAVGALCAIGGIVLAAITCAISWYYKHKNAKK